MGKRREEAGSHSSSPQGRAWVNAGSTHPQAGQQGTSLHWAGDADAVGAAGRELPGPRKWKPSAYLDRTKPVPETKVPFGHLLLVP